MSEKDAALQLPLQAQVDEATKPELSQASSSNDASPKDDAKDDEEPKEEEKKGSFKDYARIFSYAEPLDIALYTVAFVGAIAVGAALPLMTIVFGSSTSLFNQQAVGGDPSAFRDRINHLLLYFVYLFVARFVIGYLGALLTAFAAARITRALRRAYLESTLRQEVAFFDQEGNGSAATQVTTNGNRINQGIAEKLFNLVQGISLFFSAYIVALAKQWKLALIVMSTIPAIFGITGFCIALALPIETRQTRIWSRGAVLAQDALSSIKTIHAFGAGNKIVEKYDTYLEDAHKEGKKKSLLFGVLFSQQTFFVMSGTALAFWEGLRLYRSGEIPNVGTVFTVVLAVALGATSIMSVFPAIESIGAATSSAAELFSVIDKHSTIDPLSTEGLKPDSCTGDIVIRDLYFTYPSRPTTKVLQGLDLNIPAGKTTALVGPSGCGKSTIIGLLERWYEPSAGSILLDGRDVAEYNPQWLRSNVRLVQQEPVLFSGTIFENVSKGFVGDAQYLPDGKKMELVEEACKMSNAHDFILQLPEGYHSQVGERASMLSGGQRQRIAIARSIISNPKVLLLDEATSALDPRAETVVQNALNRVSAEKTCLIIAHKLATVVVADNIAVMINGRVIEQGTHHQLVEKDGMYAAMVRAQDLGHADQAEQATEDELERKQSEQEPGRLQRLQSEVPIEEEQEVDYLEKGTMNYSLLRCVWIMLLEHTDLYGWYIATMCAGVIGGGTYPAQAIIFSRLIRVFTLTGAEQKQQGDLYALLFFILAIANLLAYFALGNACNIIGQTVTHRYRREMLNRIIGFDQDFFDRSENTSGAITSKLSTAPTAMLELLSQNLGLILNLAVNVFGSSILGIAYGWKLGLVLVFGGFTVLVAAGYIRIRLDQQLETLTDKQYSASAGLATEAVTSIRTVSMLTLEPVILREYSNTLDIITNNVMRNLSWTLIPYSLSQSLEFLVMALGFWYGSKLIASGEYTITQFFVIFIAVVFGGQGTAQFFMYTTSITKATGAANYILWLRTIKSNIRETEKNRDQGPEGEGSIAVDNIHFRYKQRNASRVLRGISLDVKPGSHVAFVGPSGCGKSTMISLLERFYDPTSGKISLDGTDIASFSPHKYRKYMSLVQQEPPLYLGSVADNVAIGLDYTPSNQEIENACRKANAWDFISSLPEGLNTPCGSKGLQFSGGQRQRIAVARALVRNPRLLLLDEATSALDTQSERVIQQALDEAGRSRTTVAVAHRLSTVRHADCIFVVQDGKIAEAGTHEELLAKRGRYYAMCLAQSLDQSGDK